MAITISQEPKRTIDSTEVFFVAIDSGIWFEFEATGSPVVETKMKVDIYLADNTLVNTNDIVLFLSSVDNKVFIDIAPYLQDYLSNTNSNTYTNSIEQDNNLLQGFYLKYGEFPVPSPVDTATSSTYYATKSAKQYGDTYGQNMAKYMPIFGLTDLGKFLTFGTSKRYYDDFPVDLSFFNADSIQNFVQTEYDIQGNVLSTTTTAIAPADNSANSLNFTKINSNADKIEIYLDHEPSFTFTVDTTKAGSASDTINLPYEAAGTYAGLIDWGDGNTSVNSYANRNYTYPGGSGIYTIRITGTITGFRFNNGGDKLKITNISEWGSLNFGTSAGGFFYGCTNLDVTATDNPTLTGVTDLGQCFQSCTSLTTPNFSGWTITSVTLLDNMFKSATSFNGDLSGWNTGSCTDYSSMFQGATSFNQDIDNWTINSTGSPTMVNMFRDASSFNNGGNSMNSWNVSKVTDLGLMFNGATVFNANITSWNTIANTRLQNTFQNCTSFNQNINGWDLTACTDIQFCFRNATSFNQSLASWDVSGVTNMTSVFHGATAYKQDLSAWNFQACLNFTNFLDSVDINNPNSATNTTNYDALIIKLEADAAAVDPAQDNLSFDGGTSHYSSGAAVTAHNNLTAATPGGNGWTITDGGTP